MITHMKNGEVDATITNKISYKLDEKLFEIEPQC